MASIVLAGNTSGSITISSPSVSGTNTLTLPANTGTVITTASTFGGTGPAFSAYQSSAQTLSSATATKIQFQTEEWDTNSNYDNTTNYRFTPTVEGYYQVNCAIGLGAAICGVFITVYKNGSAFKQVTSLYSAVDVNACGGSCLVYCNGSTDYIEIYSQIETGQALATGSVQTYFQASMVRSA